MTDRYENIRKALGMGPTPGQWLICPTNSGMFVKSERLAGYFVEVRHCRTTQDVNADAGFIAACDPDTIRELLDERDALAAENARLRAEVDALRLNDANDASVQPEFVAVALATCDAVDDLIEKWYATRESGCLPNQVVRVKGASKLLRAIALEA